MKTATEVLSEIQSAAAETRPDVRRVATMKPGEYARQGDVYVTRLNELPELGKPYEGRQLAPGTSKGSRHVVALSVDADLFDVVQPGPLDGPIIDAKSRLLIEHPEHGHLDLPPGVYAVTYQRDYARERADEIRRVAD